MKLNKTRVNRNVNPLHNYFSGNVGKQRFICVIGLIVVTLFSLLLKDCTALILMVVLCGFGLFLPEDYYELD